MPYRLALVEYLNTFPFSEGIRLSGLESKSEVHRVTPALCAQLFQERKVDVSLCPVGALRDMPDYEIFGDYCIGANGEVGTVVLLSNVPLEEIKEVRLDDHSRTSNALLQMLARRLWKKDWHFYYEGSKAFPPSCIMIGDKVFQHKDRYAYAYDLAEMWMQMTGLPMVFAVWIAKPGISDEIVSQINRSFELGMGLVEFGDSGLEEWQRDYILRCISYPFDNEKKLALAKFLQYLEEDHL
jgi:chorismate dehydratase